MLSRHKKICQSFALTVILIMPLWGVANFNSSSQHVAEAQTEPDSADTTAPSTPGTPISTNRTAKTIRVSWGSSNDSGGSGLAGYEVYRNNVLIRSTSSNTFLDIGLSSGTTYSYRVVAYDNDDNTSGSSGSANISTLKRGDANGDGKVDAVDLNRLAINWGRAGATFSQGDFNEDGKVDAVDLNIVATRWGK